ncbi:MAG TPA: HupE/UreJ family protein [Gemmatimonadaceae bacterium]|nr:HupE/UreJ family protein [Gemmatimonadaceae bacterium]
MTTAALLLLAPRVANAHEIPAAVGLRIFVQQDSARVRVLARAPLEAMRDIDFPLRPGTPWLDFQRADSLLTQAAQTWILDLLHVREGGHEISGALGATRLSLTSDQAFTSFDRARRHLTNDSKIDPSLGLPVQGASLDVEIIYPLRAGGAITIEPRLARLGVRTTTVMTFVSADGRERALQYAGDPGQLRLDPRWYHATWQFVGLGFRHILDGIDHLLFIICLVLPFRKLRPLVGIVTAFTVAHSLTLVASASGWGPGALWFPPLVEVLIALSIAYMAVENIVIAARGGRGRMERRWAMAFGFGLIHGFGFAFALRESLQFAGPHLALSLVSFNVGVELGQILVLLITLPILGLLYHHVLSEKLGTILLSAFVAHTAWHWLGERWTAFRSYSVDWSTGALPMLRVILATAIGVGLAMIVTRVIRIRASRIQGDAV